MIIERRHINKVIGVGSSKAGTAALMFGMMLHFDILIIGACQYRIGTYMNCDYHKKSLQMLVGKDEVSSSDIEKLDKYVYDAVHNNDNVSKTKIFLQYSKKDHTYEEQMKELLLDLKSLGYIISEDIQDYSVHSDVAKYFPDYLKKILRQVLNTER